MSMQASDINALFGEALNRGGESLDKLAAVTGLYIQDHVRENAFSAKIMPVQDVSVAELQRNVDDEGLVFIDDLAPESMAMQINMRGEPSKTYIEGKKYAIRFSTISSDRFQKTESELRSYRMPILKIIEQNTGKDIQEIKDKIFMDHVRVGLMLATRRRMNTLIDRGIVSHYGSTPVGASALTTNKNFFNRVQFASYLYTRIVGVEDVNGAIDNPSLANADPSPLAPTNWDWGMTDGTANANYNPVTANYSNILVSEESTFSRTVLRDAVKIQAARGMPTGCFLMHQTDWQDTIGWTDSDAGLQITGEIVKDGYKYTTIGGYTFITTIRDNPDILQPGQIFTFPTPEFMGRNLSLEGLKFYINREANRISMEAWEECGMGFGNIQGLGLILLAGAQITLPNMWQTTTGTEVSYTGSFVLTNNPKQPIVNPTS